MSGCSVSYSLITSIMNESICAYAQNLQNDICSAPTCLHLTTEYGVVCTKPSTLEGCLPEEGEIFCPILDQFGRPLLPTAAKIVPRSPITLAVTKTKTATTPTPTTTMIINSDFSYASSSSPSSSSSPWLVHGMGIFLGLMTCVLLYIVYLLILRCRRSHQQRDERGPSNAHKTQRAPLIELKTATHSFPSPMLELSTVGRIESTRDRSSESAALDSCATNRASMIEMETPQASLFKMKTPLTAIKPQSPFNTVGRASFLSQGHLDTSAMTTKTMSLKL
jgi:hypothetical protein